MNTRDNSPPDGPEALFVFAEEAETTPPAVAGKEYPGPRPWKVLVVDDDNEIHNISRLVLGDFRFEGRPLALYSAHTGAEAKRLIAEHPDTALILLDVVMETDNAGLEVVRHIRQSLHNSFVRIVLRTGQPGQAPERSVVIDYDINDYKEKTELTAQKLVTTVISALRAYRDMQTIEAGRRGLEQIIDASRNLFEQQTLAQFSGGVLQQLTSLLNLGEDSLHIQCSGFAASTPAACAGDFQIVSATGRFAEHVGRCMSEVIPEAIREQVTRAKQERRTLIGDEAFIGYFQSSSGSENLVYLQARRPINEHDARLLTVFSVNIGIAFDNIHLNDELMQTQAEIIHTLSEVVETRSNETGYHVLRVGEYSRLLGELYGLDQANCDLLEMAAPMHDVGKIGIPDALLNKPERFSPEEFELMKQHARMGQDILKGSRRLPLRSAALIAGQHHEKWDGSGYPEGLAGEDIHIFGRIVALADVFDALSHQRPYKPAWPLDQVLEYIRGNSGSHFDPTLVELFLNNLDRFIAILDSRPDRPAEAGNGPRGR
ncbi:MAG: DUF3369 domain-containing protein [Rhodocyclales bacterium]|nr:DUF3369 domain-containing protein [Rhodocyclales bacterium]